MQWPNNAFNFNKITIVILFICTTIFIRGSEAAACGTVSVVESITHATCGRSGVYGISITYALSGNSQNSVCTIKLFIFKFQIFNNFTFHF